MSEWQEMETDEKIEDLHRRLLDLDKRAQDQAVHRQSEIQKLNQRIAALEKSQPAGPVMRR